MIWVVWAIVCFGAVYLVVGASITKWPRRFAFNVLGPKLGGWLACAPCTAFWVGLTVGLPQPHYIVDLASWTVRSELAVSIAQHVAGGLGLMGLTALLQWWTNALFAEIGAEERLRQQQEQRARAASLRDAESKDDTSDYDGVGHA